MARRKDSDIDLFSLMQDFISEASTSVEFKGALPVVEFAEQIIFNGDAELFPQQRAILKAFYNEPLNDLERLILNEWKEEIPFQDQEEGRTNWIEGRPYRSLCLEAGRGGSKSALGSIFALYEFYKLISMPNPARHYGLLPNDPIAIFVIAQSLEQVKDTLFAKIRGYAKDSAFFKSLEESGKIEILSESIRYPAKNVAIYAKHTNSPALVGYTLKAIILDEFARFENKVEDDGTITSVGDHLWENVAKGTHRFGMEGYKFAISSAWQVGDPMERLWEVAQKDPEIFALRLRTWDLNKLQSVSRESCNSDYIKDREKAELEFEGIRRKHKSNFITTALINSCLKNTSAIDSREIPIDVQSGDDVRHYVGIELVRVAPIERKSNSFIHLDFSVKRDATALAITSARQTEDLEGNKQWIISVDGILRWKPYIDGKGIKRIVSYNNVEDVILELCSKRRVSKVTFDQFNSESSIQRLHSFGISTEQLSCTRQAQLTYYTLFRDLCSSGLIYLPKDSIYTSLAVTELTELIIKPNGQIIHGVADKDTADAIVNSVYTCYQNMVKTGLALNICVDIKTVGNRMQKKISDRMPKDSIKRAQIGRAISTLHKKIRT